MVGGSMSTFVWHTTEPSEAARKLERLSAEGLSKEGDEWKYSFTWDAIQPQRKRYVQPFTFLTVLENCKAKFRAKVYAENFANPIVLQAEVAVAVQPRIVESDVIVGTAKHLAEEARRSTLATTVGGWNRLSTLRTLSSGNIHTD